MSHYEGVIRCFYSGKYKNCLDLLGRKPFPVTTNKDLHLASLQVGCMIFTGEFDEAKSIFQRGLDSGLQVSEYVIPCQFFLGIGEVRRSNYHSANRWIAENFWFARRQKVTSGNSLFYIFQGLAFIHFYRGNFEKCAKYTKKAYLAAFEADFAYGQALALEALGQSQCQIGEVQRGLYELRRAFEIAKSLGNGGLEVSLEVGILRFQSQYGINGPTAIKDCERLLKKLKNQNNFSRAEIYLELARQWILRGESTKARQVLESASQTIYENSNKRQLVRYNHRFAYLLFLHGESVAALALAKSVKSNLDPYVDTIFFHQLEGLEKKIENHLGISSTEKNYQKWVNFTDRRIQMRTGQQKYINVHAGEDPLGDLIDLVHRAKKDSVPQILASGYLSLLPVALDIPVDRPVIYLGLIKGKLIVSNRGDVGVSASVVTRPMTKLLLALNGGKTRCKKDLIEDVWGYKYDSMYHDSLLHATIGKIRKSLSPFGDWVEWEQDGYRLKQEVQCISSDDERAFQQILKSNSLTHQKGFEPPALNRSSRHSNFNRRQHQTMKELQIGKIIDVEEYAKIHKVSKVTATRDLSELFRAGLVDRLGKGRATCYLLNPS